MQSDNTCACGDPATRSCKHNVYTCDDHSHFCVACASESKPPSSAPAEDLSRRAEQVIAGTSRSFRNSPIGRQPCPSARQTTAHRSSKDEAEEHLRRLRRYKDTLERIGKEPFETALGADSYEKTLRILNAEQLRAALEKHTEYPGDSAYKAWLEELMKRHKRLLNFKLLDERLHLDRPGLWVGLRQWSSGDLAEFVVAKSVSDYLKERRLGKHLRKLVRFMTDNEFARFEFKDESELHSALISRYIDEHMVGLGTFQHLTHDKRGARFIQDHFAPNRDLRMTEPHLHVPARAGNAASWRGTLRIILTSLRNPPAQCYKSGGRPEGNLWIFRTMSRPAAAHLVQNFPSLKAWAVEVAEKRAHAKDGKDADAEKILHDHFTHESFRHSLRGHFGDLFQALTYKHEDDKDAGDNVLVGFKIEAGAELIMYSPHVMVFAGDHVDLSNSPLAQAMGAAFGQVNEGEGADGIVKGYVSVKHELRGDFSFGLAADPMSLVLFLLLVSEVKPYTRLA